MGKTVIYVLILILFIIGVLGATYRYLYNPYIGKLDRTLSLNQSGQNMTVGEIIIENPPTDLKYL